MLEYKICLKMPDNKMRLFWLDADIYKLPRELTALEYDQHEIRLMNVKEFNMKVLSYEKYNPSEREMEMLERQVAVKYFETHE